jgi:Peptidase family M28
VLALIPAAVLALAIDGDAALRHASSLAALGPHPWGSPRAAVAAQYVEAELRSAGLDDVRQQPFTFAGITGTNVVGVLRGSGPEFVVVGAHHDTAPDAPGAYDDGGGVGVLIETARVLAKQGRPARTIVFASFDAEESWSTRKGLTAGSRAYLASLGPEARNLVAAFVVEMCGWKAGRPVFHPIAYADPANSGRYAITPAWLMRSALASGRFPVGDPLLSWLYQPAVRTFRIGLYGDDLSFLQGGQAALFTSDSSFTAYYPWYHLPSDTADKIDAASLARMGEGVLAIVDALGRVPRGPASDPDWFAAFGHVLGGTALYAIAFLSLLPLAWRLRRAGGLALALGALHAALFLLLLWRNPVPALWVFLLPNLFGRGRRLWQALVTAVPLVLLVTLGVVAWSRGFAHGLWLSPLEIAAYGLGLAAAYAVSAGAPGAGPKRSSGGGGRKRGLPKGDGKKGKKKRR